MRIKIYEGLGGVTFITDKEMPRPYELAMVFEKVADAEQWLHEDVGCNTTLLDEDLREESRYVINDEDVKSYCFNYFEYV